MIAIILKVLTVIFFSTEKPKREPMISRVNDVENQLPHDEGKVEDTEGEGVCKRSKSQ